MLLVPTLFNLAGSTELETNDTTFANQKRSVVLPLPKRASKIKILTVFDNLLDNYPKQNFLI